MEHCEPNGERQDRTDDEGASVSFQVHRTGAALRRPSVVLGYAVVLFALLCGVVSCAPSPAATSAAMAPAGQTDPVPVLAPTTSLPPAATAPLTSTSRRSAPTSTYSTPRRPHTTAQLPGSGNPYGDTYTNVDGNQIQRPVAAASQPSGATAQCKDGTWSFSKHRSGTCSGHGGVAQWL